MEPQLAGLHIRQTGLFDPMIAVRKVEERRGQSASRRLSLRAAPGQQLALSLYDLWLAPGECIELDSELGSELITSVIAGTLTHAIGQHTCALLGPDEFQRAAIGLADDAAHTQANPSRSEMSHVVQILLHDPRLSLVRRQEQRRFSLAQRRGLLCPIAARKPSAGLLPVQSGLALYSSVMEPGQHMVHGFAAAHSGVLHVVSGQLSVAGYVLGAGDTAYVQAERSLGFTARDHAEVLLADVHGLTSF